MHCRNWLIYSYLRTTNILGKVLADAVSKVEDIRLSAQNQTDVVISLHKGNCN